MQQQSRSCSIDGGRQQLPYRQLGGDTGCVYRIADAVTAKVAEQNRTANSTIHDNVLMQL